MKFAIHPVTGVAVRQAMPLFIPDIILDFQITGSTVGRVRVSGKIDTGASRTTIPLSATHIQLTQTYKFQVPPSGFGSATGFDRAKGKSDYPIFPVYVTLPGLPPKEIRAFGCQRSDVLIGLDFLEGITLMATWHEWFGYRQRNWLDTTLQRLF